MEEVLKTVQQYGLLDRLSKVEFFESKIKSIEFLPKDLPVEQPKYVKQNNQAEIENTLFYAAG
ncbi:MAG: hypothetical protein HC877_24375 [Thioploca sp.]|nr:hypothetical protein [Thioploca sp.]